MNAVQPSPTPDREDLLMQQIQALDLIMHGLNDLFLNNNDPDLGDEIRLQRARLRETLFVKQAQLDAVRAMSVIPAASETEVTAIETALNELDTFVMADQEAHASLKLLTEIAARFA
jgi:hypothetical protein